MQPPHLLLASISATPLLLMGLWAGLPSQANTERSLEAGSALLAAPPTPNNRIWVRVVDPITLTGLASALNSPPRDLSRLNSVNLAHRFGPGDWVVMDAAGADRVVEVMALDSAQIRRTPPAKQILGAIRALNPGTEHSPEDGSALLAAPPTPNNRIWVRVVDPITLTGLASAFNSPPRDLSRLNSVNLAHRFGPGDWVVMDAAGADRVVDVMALDSAQIRRTPPAKQILGATRALNPGAAVGALIGVQQPPDAKAVGRASTTRAIKPTTSEEISLPRRQAPIPVKQIPGATRALNPGAAVGALNGAGSGLAREVVVKPGDTLSEIAERYGVSMLLLMQVNGLEDPGHVEVGQSLRLSGAAAGKRDESSLLHTVKPGETLSEIAEQYDVSTAQLAALNQLDDNDYVQAGDRLRLPKGLRVPARSLKVDPDASGGSSWPESPDFESVSNPFKGRSYADAIEEALFR